MRIVLFHHIYDTPEGLRIAKQQQDVISRVGPVNIRTYHEPVGGRLYEGATLEPLHYYASSQKEETFIGYIHTKGASITLNRKGVEVWRKQMEAIVLHKWLDCVKALSDCDCYGAYLTDDTRYFFPGNFWWSKASHIKRLPNPRQWAEGLRSKPDDNSRYGYEDWITLSHPGTIAKADKPWRP